MFQLVERSLDNRTSLVAPIGDLDAATNPAFRDALREAASRHDGTLVVDLSQVGFLSAAALGIIARAGARVESREGEMLVVCPSPTVRRLFEIAGLDRSLRIVPGLGA